MKTFIYTLLILLVSFSCSSEGDGDTITKDGPFKISELAGTWEATQASFSSGSMNVNIITDGGTVSMVVQSSGRFTLTIDPVDRNSYTVSGEMFWEEWEGNFYFAIEWDDSPGDWDTYGHSLVNDILTITGGFDTGEYDFDNDGDMESASISFTFVRV